MEELRHFEKAFLDGGDGTTLVGDFVPITDIGQQLLARGKYNSANSAYQAIRGYVRLRRLVYGCDYDCDHSLVFSILCVSAADVNTVLDALDTNLILPPDGKYLRSAAWEERNE